MYVFWVANYEFSVRFHKFKIADLICVLCWYKISMKLLKKTLVSLYISWYNLLFLDFLGKKYQIRKSKFKIADPIWLPCCYKVSIKLAAIPMEYIFIHAKKDVITTKSDGMKNSKEKSKLSAKKWLLERF